MQPKREEDTLLATRAGVKLVSRRNLTLALVWFLGTFASLFVFWVLKVRPYYVESAFAELVNTTHMYHPPLVNFFFGPVNRYSVSYAEWTSLSRDLIRPVVALDYYFWSLLFGADFSAYLMGSYLCMAGLCGITFYIAVELLEFPLALSNMLAALVFLSPANGEQERFSVTFAPDPLAAFWILAASMFFLRRNYLLAWLFLAAAVGTKETAWPFSIGMAILFFCFADRSRLRRFAGGLAYLLPLAAMLCLRVQAFGLQGVVKSDRAASTIHSSSVLAVHSGNTLSHATTALSLSSLMAISGRLLSWPFGVMLDSFQYEPRLLRIFYRVAIMFNITFWLAVVITGLLFIICSHGSLHLQTLRMSIRRIRLSGDRCYANRFSILGLALSGLAFLLRFASPPRYAAGTYPLLFLCAALVITFSTIRWQRVLAWIFLAGVGSNGLALWASDMTHGTYVYRSMGQLEQSFLSKIKSNPGGPIFLVDDVAGGENNTESFRRAFGLGVEVIRVNDLATSCFQMPASGPPPVKLAVQAVRKSLNEFVVHSVIEGCGGHQFFEVPGLPEGTIQRRSEGYRFTYTLNPRVNAQPTAGPSRQMTVKIEGPVTNAVVLMPDFVHHLYVSIPIE